MDRTPGGQTKERTFFEEVITAFRSYNVDVVISIVRSGNQLSKEALAARDSVISWLASFCTQVNSVLLLRCTGIARHYDNYVLSPSTFRDPLARQLFEHLSHTRTALEASPPVEVHRRFAEHLVT